MNDIRKHLSDVLKSPPTPYIGQIFYWNGYEATKIIKWDTTEGMDGYPKDYALLHFIDSNQLRVVLQRTFFKKAIPAWKKEFETN
jgi:hypothetical protein